MPQVALLSEQIENWLESGESKTLGHLVDVFGKDSFATIFILCMALPALPIPTGGITHVLEIVTMLVAAETLLGLKNLWLPQFVRRRKVPKVITRKALPLFVVYLKRFEKYSRVRGERILNDPWVERFTGLAVLIFTAGAFAAIPFSGLDTVVSMGVVLLSLGLVTNDISFFIIGLLVGGLGIVIEVVFGAFVARHIESFFRHASTEVRISALILLAVIIFGFVIRHYRKSK